MYNSDSIRFYATSFLQTYNFIFSQPLCFVNFKNQKAAIQSNSHQNWMAGKCEKFGRVFCPLVLSLRFFPIFTVGVFLVFLNVLADKLVDSIRVEYFDGTISNKAHDNVLTSDLDLAQGNLLLNTFLIIN